MTITTSILLSSTTTTSRWKTAKLLRVVVALAVAFVIVVVEVSSTMAADEGSPSTASFSTVEVEFRRTVDEWHDKVQYRLHRQRTQRQEQNDDDDSDGDHGSNPWTVWSDYASRLSTAFDDIRATMEQESNDVNQEGRKKRKKNRSTTMSSRLLEIVGGCEEGILFIEKHIYEQQSGSDRMRDVALARLYTTYGIMLSHLTPSQCFRLASDVRTLLVGAPETMDKLHETQQRHGSHDDDDEEDISSRIERLFRPLCIENADNALRNAIALDARNTEAPNQLEKLDNKSNDDEVHSRKGQEFVALLFDEVANEFDQRLLVDLQYQVPTIIGTTVRERIVMGTAQKDQQQQQQHYFRAALDAGCGTGLAGRQIRNMVDGPMVGVDASSKMLDVARQCTYSRGCESTPSLHSSGVESSTVSKNKSRPLYETLLQMDLEDMNIDNTLPANLRSVSTDGFDLIVAADVLVYFGNLERIMEVFSNLSSPTTASYLVFTCERATNYEAPRGYRLLPTGRFAHTKQHALDMAKRVGYELLHYDEIIPRKERDEPVQGHLFVFVHPSPSRLRTDEL